MHRDRRGARSAWSAMAMAMAVAVVGCTATETGLPRAADDTSTTRPAVRSSPAQPTSTAPSDPTRTTSAAPSTQAPPLTVPELKPLLLKRSELGSIMADTDMQQLEGFDHPIYSTAKITPVGCRAVALPAETQVWSEATKALVGDANRGAGGQAATQVVALQTSPAVAANTVTTIADEWQRQCPTGQPFTMDLPAGQQQWNPGAVQSSGQPLRISVTFTRADPPRSCTHAYTSANNVLIESLACGTADTAAQAATILDRIAAEVH